MISLRRMVDIALFSCALGLGLYLGATSDQPTSAEREARKNNILSSFSEASVQSIHLVNEENGSQVHLRRDKGSDELDRYFLGKTGEILADPAQVGELLRVLSLSVFLRNWATVEAPPGDLGFRKPRLELRVEAGARSFRVLVGNNAEVPKDSVYVQVAGSNREERVGVVAGSFLKQLTLTEQQFRGDLLFPYSRTRTSKLSILAENGPTTLVSDGLGFLIEPHIGTSKLRADRSASDLIFFQLARAKIERHLSPEEVEAAQAKLPAENFQLSMKSPDGPDVEVTLGGDCPGDLSQTLGLRLKPDPVAGCVPRAILAAIRSAETRLPSRSAVPLNADEIDHVVVECHDRRIDLIVNGANYFLNGEKRTQVPEAAAKEFFSALADAKSTSIRAPSGVPFPVGTMTIKGQSSRSFDPKDPQNEKKEALRQLSVDIYRADENQELIFQRRDDSAWLKPPETLRWAFTCDDAWTKNRSLSRWQEGDIREVTIIEGKWKSTLKRSPSDEKNGKSFVLVEEAGIFPADSSLSRQLLEELSHLEARRFVVAPDPKPPSGLLEISFDLKRTPDDASERETLWIGPRTRGGVVAWASFVDGTFVLPLGSRVVFETPLLDRSPLSLDPSSIRSLQISFDGRNYSFEQNEAGLSPAGGDSSSDMLEPLKEALLGLHIVSALPRGIPGSTSTPSRLSLRGRKLDAQGAEEDFAVHFGRQISIQGQAAVVCWREGSSDIFAATEASYRELTELL